MLLAASLFIAEPEDQRDSYQRPETHLWVPLPGPVHSGNMTLDYAAKEKVEKLHMTLDVALGWSSA